MMCIFVSGARRRVLLRLRGSVLFVRVCSMYIINAYNSCICAKESSRVVNHGLRIMLPDFTKHRY